jgi:hypothetical protein
LITFFLAKKFPPTKQPYLLWGCVTVKIGPGGGKNTEKSRESDKAGIAIGKTVDYINLSPIFCL